MAGHCCSSHVSQPKAADSSPCILLTRINAFDISILADRNHKTMAEIIGAVSGAVTLFMVLGKCLDAFDVITEGRSQSSELQKLLVRLKIERVHLYTWGRAVGLSSSPPDSACGPHGQGTAIRDALRLITDLLEDAERIQTRYGCCKVECPVEVASEMPVLPGLLDHLAAPFANFSLGDEPKTTPKLKSLFLKGRWVIHDKVRFKDLIQDIKEFIDGIYSVTRPLLTIDAAERDASRGLCQIDDVKTLELVSIACQIDYPALSDAASVRVDVLSQSSSQRRGILSWIEQLALENTSQVTVQVPSLSTSRLRVANHHGRQVRLVEEKALDIETLITPLSGADIKRIDEVVLRYLDYRGLQHTAKALREETRAEVFGTVMLERVERRRKASRSPSPRWQAASRSPSRPLRVSSSSSPQDWPGPRVNFRRRTRRSDVVVSN